MSYIETKEKETYTEFFQSVIFGRIILTTVEYIVPPFSSFLKQFILQVTSNSRILLDILVTLSTQMNDF